MRNKVKFLKRLYSFCLSLIIVFPLVPLTYVNASGGYTINQGLLTDDFISLDYLYSYPMTANNWHLVTKTRTFGKYEVTGVQAVCPDGSGSVTASANWVVPGSFTLWYSIADDRRFEKAEFYVWLNDNVGSKLPVIKFKTADNTETVAQDVVWTTAIAMDEVDTNYYRQMKGTVTVPPDVKMVGIGFPDKTIAANSCFFDKAMLYSEMSNYRYPKMYEAYEDYFDISVAIEPKDAELYPELMENQFNVIVPENQMKSWIHKGEDIWWWQGADQIVDYAMKNGKKVRAHTLVYPDAFDRYRSNENAWFYKDENGVSLLDDDDKVIDLKKANELTLKRLEKHIKTIMERYKGRVYAYDVVNEAFMERGAERTYLEFIKLLEGTDWFTKCFEWAHEADPDAVLIYNDNGFTYDILKQDVIYNKIKELRDKGIPVQIGMQMHYNAETDLNLVENVLKRFSPLCDIYITEHEVLMSQSVITDKTEVINDKGHIGNSFETVTYPDYMYDEAMEIQAKKYGSLFDLFRKYSDSIKAVGFWDSCDGRTYAGTEKYPLPFDENGEPKAAFYRIMDFDGKLPRWEEGDKSPKYRRFDYEIDEAVHIVRIRGNTDGEASAVLYNPDGTENNHIGVVSDGSFLIELPILTEKIPANTVPEYTLSLKLGDNEEIKERFVYYTPQQQESYYAIHDEMNDFSKVHSVYNVRLESYHTFYDDDICGMGIKSSQHDSYIIYKVPENKNVKSVTVDCYVFNKVSGVEFPEIYTSSDADNYALISENKDWDRIPKVSHNDDGEAIIRHHYRAELDNLTDGMKYVKIDLSSFSDWWYINVADVKIETENDSSYEKPAEAEVFSDGISLYANTERGSVLAPYIHGGEFTFKTNVKNNSDEEKDIMLMSALKSSALLLKGAENTKTLSAGGKAELSLKLDIKPDSKYEFFLFDVSGGLKPVLSKNVYEMQN